MEHEIPLAPPEQPRSRGRVVILDPDRNPRVEILPLPEGATLGTRFSHAGISWRVTGLRTHQRVLIAEPNGV
jgi:hypothetical protein